MNITFYEAENDKVLRQDNSSFKILLTIWFTWVPENYFIKLYNTCSLTKFRVISRFTGPSPLGPNTFLYRINTSGVKNRLVKSWYCDNNYNCVNKMVAVNCYLWQGSEHPYGTEYVRVLNIPWLNRVLNKSEYVWTIPRHPWFMLEYVGKCLIMPKCAWICLNLPEWLFFYMSPSVIPCVLECVVTYFKEVYNLKEHVTVFLFFFEVFFFSLFGFRLNIFTNKI